jgi:hypothetical protein
MNKYIHSIRRKCTVLKISRATKHRRDTGIVPESNLFKVKAGCSQVISDFFCILYADIALHNVFSLNKSAGY